MHHFHHKDSISTDRNLYDENDAFTGNRIFVVVTNGIENGTPNNLESEYSDFGNRNGFYLAQENAEGLPVNSSARKMDINTVNLDFENKTIPLGVTGKLVGIALIEGKLNFGIQDVTINGDDEFTMSLEQGTIEELQTLLNTLN